MTDASENLKTLLGEPKKAIRSMVLAFFIAMAVVELNQFVDTFWVSGLGAVSSSAVATSSPIYGLMMCAGLGIGVGATATIAFRLGRGDFEEANRLAANSLLLGILCAVVSSVLVLVFARPLILIMGAGSIVDECLLYILPFIFLSPFLLCNSILGGILRAEGAARKSTIVQMSAAILNMIIDPILIYGLGLGVFGAGLSTALSAGIALAIGLSWYANDRMTVKLSRASFKRDTAMSREVLDVGGPKTVQALVSNTTDLIQRVFLIVAGGTNAVMFYNYSWRYIAIINLPGRAYENAMVPVCSAAYGQRDLLKMREGFLYTAKWVLIFSAIFAVVLFVFSEPLMSILTYEDSMKELRPQFIWTLQISTLLIPFSALMGIGSSMLQALKKSKVSMYYYFFWGFVKLGMYAVAAYVYHSFEYIIYCMVIVHV
ncbi:MAG: MATE family efflux transporter, partial [Methanomethylophilus sp.]|nr:MATE family efflux transporter [Methanomethylophilus sp.]